MSENPYILPAQRGYSREDGWHWLLMNEDREVVGLLIELPAPRHHQGLWGVPETVNANLLEVLEGLLTDTEVLLFLPNYNRTARTCSGCGSSANNDTEIEHDEDCSVGRAIAAVKKARKE